MHASRFWAFAIAGWSGFYVMVVELLCGRLMAPYFGSSIYVWGSVIFVFMLALSAGYLIGGRYSRRSPSLARLSGILAISALTTLPTVAFGPAILDAIFGLEIDPRYGSLLSCALLYAVPTVFAGMISPYAIRIISDDPASVGSDAGNLYFFSTLGSSAGTLLTSFYLVLWLEVDVILLSAVAISLALAATCVLATRGYRKGEAHASIH